MMRRPEEQSMVGGCLGPGDRDFNARARVAAGRMPPGAMRLRLVVGMSVLMLGAGGILGGR